MIPTVNRERRHLADGLGPALQSIRSLQAKLVKLLRAQVHLKGVAKPSETKVQIFR